MKADRLTILERRISRLHTLLIALVVVIGCGLLLGATGTFSILTVSKILVPDLLIFEHTNGRKLAELRTDMGETQFVLYNSRGREVVRMETGMSDTGGMISVKGFPTDTQFSEMMGSGFNIMGRPIPGLAGRNAWIEISRQEGIACNMIIRGAADETLTLSNNDGSPTVQITDTEGTVTHNLP